MEKLPSVDHAELVVGESPSVDIVEAVLEKVLSLVDILGLVVDSCMDEVVIMSVVLMGKLVVERPGRRDFEACFTSCPCFVFLHSGHKLNFCYLLKTYNLLEFSSVHGFNSTDVLW